MRPRRTHQRPEGRQDPDLDKIKTMNKVFRLETHQRSEGRQDGPVLRLVHLIGHHRLLCASACVRRGTRLV